jgi:hypothetical protein
MKMIPFSDVYTGKYDPREAAVYVWTECGDGQLCRITGTRFDGTGYWAITTYNSWCMCGSDPVYLCNGDADRAETETALQHLLAARRAEWDQRLQSVTF